VPVGAGYGGRKRFPEGNRSGHAGIVGVKKSISMVGMNEGHGTILDVVGPMPGGAVG